MTIGPSKAKKFHTAMLFAIVSCGLFLVQSLGPWSWHMALLFLVSFALCIRQWIATGRTIIFSSDGISIWFLWRSRFVPWTDITYAATFDCNDHFESRLYDHGVEFCTKDHKRPHWMGVGLYGTLFHPMTYVYAYFGPQSPISKRNGFPPEYEVDEVAFRELLKKWNVTVGEMSL